MIKPISHITAAPENRMRIPGTALSRSPFTVPAVSFESSTARISSAASPAPSPAGTWPVNPSPASVSLPASIAGSVSPAFASLLASIVGSVSAAFASLPASIAGSVSPVSPFAFVFSVHADAISNAIPPGRASTACTGSKRRMITNSQI